jgi:NADH:ubiquinone oxidoreductase subunit F (NADH-binding)
VCNADEGDPGAFMDRSLLEGDPHRVLEGILIAAYAIGAEHAFIYCRAEYPLAIRRLEIAMAQARLYGLIGPNILGTGKSLHVEIVQGAGAFVCGEETAMISSIEGKRGMARNKPPYPAQHGFSGHPTCVNNVETFANVPLILAKGVEWFRSVGTEKNAAPRSSRCRARSRTRAWSKCPWASPCASCCRTSAAARPRARPSRARRPVVRRAGASRPTGWMCTVDYESLRRLGGMMGSGGLVVTDSGTCMVNFAKFFLGFTQHESCGKCIPCREGTKRMLEILERITDGKGKMEDITELRHLAWSSRAPRPADSEPRRRARWCRPCATSSTSTSRTSRTRAAWPACAARCSPTTSWPTAAVAACARAAARSSASAATRATSTSSTTLAVSSAASATGFVPSAPWRVPRGTEFGYDPPIDVNLTINDLPVRVPAGSTILEAAQALSIRIPTLCYDKQLTVSGACRMCVVEVANPTGSTRLEPSCSFPVQEGMKVRTNTRELRDARRTIIELILANHPARLPDLHPQRALQLAVGFAANTRSTRFATRAKSGTTPSTPRRWPSRATRTTASCAASA